MTVINLNPLDQPDRGATRNTPGEVAAVRRVIAAHATGPDDQAYLLRVVLGEVV